MAVILTWMVLYLLNCGDRNMNIETVQSVDGLQKSGKSYFSNVF